MLLTVISLYDVMRSDILEDKGENSAKNEFFSTDPFAYINNDGIYL